MRRGVLILSGPTASGKSALALSLARRYGAEIVGADSRQIYRGMPVGTAAPSAADLAAVPHHLVGFVDPHDRYSAAAFVRDAMGTLEAIEARGRPAIVAGGTGFYLRALSGGVELSETRDDAVRDRLAREAKLHPPDVMHDWLRALDPQRATDVRTSDRYRVTRALEIALAGRGGGSAAASAAPVPVPTLRSAGIPFRHAYLDVPMAILEERIGERVGRMLGEGLVDEAERIGPGAVAADAVGYPQALAYLRGFSTRAELRAQLVRATRQYAKRQATWFRSEPGITRIAPEPDALDAIVRELGWGS